MVDKQSITERENGPLDSIRDIAKRTAPGKPNSDLFKSLDDVRDVVIKFDKETNSWFEILDVRVYRGNNIGIPCRYRWTIKRWVVNDMDQWLIDNGWELLPHLKADSKDHNDNEMEARYRKNINGYDVHCNFYVEFTNDVFEALQGGTNIKPPDDTEEGLSEMDKIRQKVRG